MAVHEKNYGQGASEIRSLKYNSILWHWDLCPKVILINSNSHSRMKAQRNTIENTWMISWTDPATQDG
jgi:hypothetical protein